MKDLPGDVTNVKGATNPDAARDGEILFMTVLLLPRRRCSSQSGEGAACKPLLDATGVLASAIGGSAAKCLHLPECSAAPRAQAVLPEARVIGAFNNSSQTWFMQLDEPIDCDCLSCGDDLQVKELVTPLIEESPGRRVIDCGGPDRSGIIEKSTPLLIGLNIRNRYSFGNIRITGLDKVRACYRRHPAGRAGCA